MLQVGHRNSGVPKFVKKLLALIVVHGIPEDGVQFDTAFQTGYG